MSASLSHKHARPTIQNNHQVLYKDLLGLLGGLGPNVDATPVVKSVWDHYQQASRHYHNLDHIAACLKAFAVVLLDARYNQSLHLREQDIQAIELGVWFHDVVYDATRQDNEEMSVAFLRESADKLQFNHNLLVEIVADAIMHTRHTTDKPPGTDVAKWVLDLDLSVFSAPKKAFDEYEKNVRKEYAFVEDPLWIAGRMKVLQSFLDREWIYSTPLYRRLHEGEARENIKRSLARLEKGEILK